MGVKSTDPAGADKLHSMWISQSEYPCSEGEDRLKICFLVNSLPRKSVSEQLVQNLLLIQIISILTV